jgi:hypothetical protein
MCPLEKTKKNTYHSPLNLVFSRQVMSPERLNKILSESVLAILFQARLPKSFWAEAMATAAHIRNFMPSEAVNGNIPYELWEGRKVTREDYGQFFLFGCIAHVLDNVRVGNGKVIPKSRRSCFVGYITYKKPDDGVVFQLLREKSC